MDGELGNRVLNTNPSRFEELAGVIATAYAYYEEGNGLERLHSDFVHLYRRALDQPPSYSEINEITGQSLSSGDRMAGQMAWMLQKIEDLRIYGVHSMLWHEVDKVFTAPLLDQVGIVPDNEEDRSLPLLSGEVHDEGQGRRKGRHRSMQVPAEPDPGALPMHLSEGRIRRSHTEGGKSWGTN